MGFDLYLVPPDGHWHPVDMQTYEGFAVADTAALIKVLTEAPRRRLGEHVRCGGNGEEFAWETAGFTVELLCQPSDTSTFVVAAALYHIEDIEDEREELAGLFDALVDVADVACGLWWCDEFGGALRRTDRERFVSEWHGG